MLGAQQVKIVQSAKGNHIAPALSSGDHVGERTSRGLQRARQSKLSLQPMWDRSLSCRAQWQTHFVLAIAESGGRIASTHAGRRQLLQETGSVPAGLSANPGRQPP